MAKGFNLNRTIRSVLGGGGRKKGIDTNAILLGVGGVVAGLGIYYLIFGQNAQVPIFDDVTGYLQGVGQVPAPAVGGNPMAQGAAQSSYGSFYPAEAYQTYGMDDGLSIAVG